MKTEDHIYDLENDNYIVKEDLTDEELQEIKKRNKRLNGPRQRAKASSER